MNECYALLDDCHATAADPRSRLYTGHAGSLQADDEASLAAMLAAMQEALLQGLHAVGMFDYELGARMHGIAARDREQTATRVLLFRHCERMSSQQVAHWLAQRGDGPAGVAGVAADTGEAAFIDAVERIRAYIEAGDVYQINYTYRLHFDVYGEPAALYRRLRERQPVPYGALIALPDGGSLLSLSPELFVRHDAGLLTARPMKGTAAAGDDPATDRARAAALAADVKNRAENLMIVDLLRNDLGRVARLGSVRVPRLFSVDRHGAVLQMTSTVQADLKQDAGLQQLLAALYPCGSITGAPKRRAMQIIRELESDARGIYTGALGWFDAPPQGTPSRPGDFCLSVPIRTLHLQAPRSGLRRGRLGVGAGIVHDSKAQEELAECRLKAGFLTGLQHAFELFETMHATRAGCRHLELHLRRLQASATYFGFAFDEAGLRAQLQQACAAFADDVPHRLRLALRQDGSSSLQYAVLPPVNVPVKVFIADSPRRADDLFLRHKSSLRAEYDAGWRAAEARGGFDMLFFNERGELTEGGRSNVFLRLDGHWYTPAAECGLLPGVMRSVLLADPAWNARERRLTRDDLLRADALVLCNALRGVLAAQLVAG